MHRLIGTSVLALFIGTGLTGCAEMSKTEQGATIGAVAGGVVGATVSKDKAKGAVIGAVVGAVAGGIIGNYQDKQMASRAEAAKKYGYGANQGDRLEVEASSLQPQDVAPGATVQSSVQYTALSSTDGQQIRIKETRTLLGAQDTIQLAEREVVRDQGSHTSTFKFTMPKDFPKGDYTLVTTISDGKQAKTARDSLRVI
jgi:hypothetical protein